MALKGLYDRAEDAPEPLREHLIEKDGKWTLDVEGYVTKSTLDEFRNNNRQLNRDKEKFQKDWEAAQAALAEVQAKYKDIDPDEYKALKTAPTDVQRQIAEAEGRIKQTYEQTYGARFAEFETRAKQAEAKLNVEKIKAEVARMGPTLGVRRTSLHNLQRDAVDACAIIDDEVVPMEKGQPRYSEKSPSKHMDLGEWISMQVPLNPDYFESSSGGGANGGVGGQSRNGRHVVAASDSKSFLANIEKIAKGEIDVDLSA